MHQRLPDEEEAFWGAMPEQKASCRPPAVPHTHGLHHKHAHLHMLDSSRPEGMLACGAVELAREEEASHALGLQAGVALVGRQVIIFHCRE